MPWGIRTLDLLLRRQLLYPAELKAQTTKRHLKTLHVSIFASVRGVGAGDGNRTRTTSLEGWDSTTELHPQIKHGDIIRAGEAAL